MKLVKITTKGNQTIDFAKVFMSKKVTSTELPVTDLFDVLYTFDMLNKMERDDTIFNSEDIALIKIDTIFTDYIFPNSITFSGKSNELDYLNRDAFQFLKLDTYNGKDNSIGYTLLFEDGTAKEMIYTPKVLRHSDLLDSQDAVVNKTKIKSEYASLDTIRKDLAMSAADHNSYAICFDGDWLTTQNSYAVKYYALNFQAFKPSQYRHKYHEVLADQFTERVTVKVKAGEKV